LLIEAGCAMRFDGRAGGFTFWLDAVREVSYVVICDENCADVLKKLSGLAGRPALLPKWAYGYIQSKERYKTAGELADVARRYRELGVPLDCVVQDWQTWPEGRWGEKRLDKTRYGVIFWSVTVINCDEDIEDVRLAVGSNCGSMWWLNGEELLLMATDRHMGVDSAVSKRVTLKKGKNILRGATINGIGMSEFCARFLDADGRPLTTGYTVSCE
jgi:hypothetical protein